MIKIKEPAASRAFPHSSSLASVAIFGGWGVFVYFGVGLPLMQPVEMV